MSDPAGWLARRSSAGEAALWTAGALLFAAVAILVLGGSREPSWTMVVLCAVGAVLLAAGVGLLLWGLAYRRLRYVLTDTSLRVDWLGRVTVVPYGAIHGIYTGQRLAGNALANRPRWPGINVGTARVRGLGRLRYFATSTNQADLTFITVEHGGVIVSAADPHAFRAALIEHVESSDDLADSNIWHQTEPTSPPWTAIRDLWLVACIGLACVALLAVLLAITARFAELPAQIIMHFDGNGQPSQVASKYDLLRLPFFGVLLLLIDAALGVWLHARDRLLARLLWLGGVLVQVVLLIGVLRLVA